MKFVCRSLELLLVALAPLALFPCATCAQHYNRTDLLSDIMGAAPVQDSHLVNAWGLSRSSTSPWWVSDNGTGLTTLYTGAGAIVPINGTGFVTIPAPKNAPAGTIATPTGTVYNGSSTDFILPAPNGKAATFMFCTEDGTISGWNGGPTAVIAVDDLEFGKNSSPVYKGMTTADFKGKRYVYVTNFRAGRVEVYDTNFQPVHFFFGAFDPNEGDDYGEHIPRGFAPFNIQNIGGSLFVTYAKQDSSRHDDVAGDGNGFVEIFTSGGRHIAHLQHGPWLNSPWGVVWTPRDFGEFSNTILVGNFGSGKIAAFNGFTYQFMGFVKNPDDSTLVIDGLWALAFGNGANAGPSTTLYFTAGPSDESHGLFGMLTAVAAEQDGDEE